MSRNDTRQELRFLGLSSFFTGGAADSHRQRSPSLDRGVCKQVMDGEDLVEVRSLGPCLRTDGREGSGIRREGERGESGGGIRRTLRGDERQNPTQVVRDANLSVGETEGLVVPTVPFVRLTTPHSQKGSTGWGWEVHWFRFCLFVVVVLGDDYYKWFTDQDPYRSFAASKVLGPAGRQTRSYRYLCTLFLPYAKVLRDPSVPGRRVWVHTYVFPCISKGLPRAL